MGEKAQVGMDDVSNAFELIPAGRYPAKLIDVNEEDSSQGNPMLVWDWTIVSGDHEGKEMRSWTSLLPNALIGCKNHFIAFGGSWKAGDKIESLAKKFIGKRVILQVGLSKFKNRNTQEEMENNRIIAVYPPASNDSVSDKKKTEKGSGSQKYDDVPF